MQLLEAEWTVETPIDGWWLQSPLLLALTPAMARSGLALPLRFFGPLMGDQVEFETLDELTAQPGLATIREDEDEDDVFLSTDSWPLDGSWIRLTLDRDAGTLGLRIGLHPDSRSGIDRNLEDRLRTLAARVGASLPGAVQGGILDLSTASTPPPPPTPPAAPPGSNPMRSFETPQLLADALSWTAEYDSFDQRHNDVYFGIVLWRGGQEVDRFMVVVDEYVGKWDGQQRRFDATRARDHYRERLSAAAASGASNTEHGTVRFPGQG